MSQGKTLKIFIVDDDEMLLMALQDFLMRSNGRDVQTFTTGEDCLKHLSERPDVIVLDYFLNTTSRDAANGIEILQEIKKRSLNTHVIMLSSQEKYGVALQTIQKGAEQYVIKGEDAFEKIDAMINEFS